MRLIIFFILFNLSYCFAPNYILLKTKFNDVNFNKGLMHIHTPEHIINTHMIGSPLFKFHKINNPIKLDNITTINFKCSVMNFNEMDVKMYSRYVNRCSMDFYINNNFFITLQITILPDFENKNNHYFMIKVIPNDFLYKFKNFLKVFFQLSMFISTTEDKLFFFNNKNRKNNYNHNLKKYRKLAFERYA